MLKLFCPSPYLPTTPLFLNSFVQISELVTKFKKFFCDENSNNFLFSFTRCFLDGSGKFSKDQKNGAFQRSFAIWKTNIINRESVRLAGNTVQFVQRSDKETAVRNGRSGNAAVTHIILCEEGEFRSGFQNDDKPVFTSHVNFSVSRDRRSIVVSKAADSLAIPGDRAVLQMESRRNAPFFDKEQLIF